MGRQYAGILGLIAFTVVIIRSIRYGAGVESALFSACAYLLFFSIVGYLAGQLAVWIVDDSVRKSFAEQLASAQTPEQ